ncbi:MAG: flagellar hook capping FlgD N-terminal domain-containing protein [Pseudomonadota bacterium]
MDPVNATSTTTARQQTTSAEDDANSTANVLTSDFDTFLTLLTAQLENQDPLSPADSTEWVTQLATFSSVEQQIQTNDTLNQIASSVGQNEFDSVAELMGQTVESRASNVRFNGQEVSFSTPDAAQYDRVVAAIRDTNGEIAGRVELDKSQTEHVWRGEDGTGGRVLNGDYTIELEYMRGNSVARTEVAPQIGTVEAARLGSDGWRLTLSSGASIGADEITAILPRDETS